MNLLPYTFLSCGAPLATATLSALIAHAALPARVLVASAPPPPPAAQTLPVATSDDIASIAAAHNLPLAYTGADTDAAIRAALGQCGTLVLIVCLGTILSPMTLALASEGCLNVHPSCLPSYRGPAPMFWQLRDGLTTGTVSVHRVNARIDAGSILLQSSFALPHGVNEIAAETLAGAAVGPTLAELLRNWPQRRHEVLEPTAPDSYQGHPDEAAFAIDAGEWSLERATHFIRATQWRGQPYLIHSKHWRAIVTSIFETRAATTAVSSTGSTVCLPFREATLVARGALLASN